MEMSYVEQERTDVHDGHRPCRTVYTSIPPEGYKLPTLFDKRQRVQQPVIEESYTVIQHNGPNRRKVEGEWAL